MKNKKSKNLKSESDDLEELDPKEGFGIFPENISLTQNIGCSGGKKPKDKTYNNNNN